MSEEMFLRRLGLYPENSPEARFGDTVYTFLFSSTLRGEDLRREVLQRAVRALRELDRLKAERS